MKFWLRGFFLIFLFACNGPTEEAGTASEDKEEVSEITEEVIVAAPSFAKNFPGLFQFLKSEDSTFSPAQFTQGEIISKDSSSPRATEPSTLNNYRPYFIYNDDSTLALDLVSYNFIIANIRGMQELEFAGPDTEVGLINIQNNTRKRILFLGSSGMVLDGNFENSGNILLAGAEDVGDGKLHPLMWRYYPSTKELEAFTYPGTIEADVSKYYELKYKPFKTSRAF